MKQLKLTYFLIIMIFLSSCGTIKKGFENQKKNSSDEFLVEKKKPLVMPPEFNELPIPQDENSLKKKDENNFRSLLSDNKSNEIEENNEDKNSGSLEYKLLKKIKNN